MTYMSLLAILVYAALHAATGLTVGKYMLRYIGMEDCEWRHLRWGAAVFWPLIGVLFCISLAGAAFDRKNGCAHNTKSLNPRKGTITCGDCGMVWHLEPPSLAGRIRKLEDCIEGKEG